MHHNIQNQYPNLKKKTWRDSSLNQKYNHLSNMNQG